MGLSTPEGLKSWAQVPEADQLRTSLQFLSNVSELYLFVIRI